MDESGAKKPLDEAGAKKLLEFLLRESKKRPPKTPFDDYKKAKNEGKEKKYLKDVEGFNDDEIDYITGGGSTTRVAVQIPPQDPTVWQPPTVWQ
jgi:hypothetical protein